MLRRSIVPVVSFALAGCSDQGDPASVHGSARAEDAALVTDVTLSRATPLRATPVALGSSGSRSIDDPRMLASLPTRFTLTEGPVDGGPTSLQNAVKKDASGAEPPVDGYLAYLQATPGRYEVRLARVKDPQGAGKLIYRGEREIDSVSVSLDGKLVTFAARSPEGDFDVFLIDMDGSLLGAEGAVGELPSTTFDEVDVSMSLDGSVHAWGSFDELSGTTNHVVARLDRATGALELEPFDISLGGVPIEQLQPVLTGSGEDVFFVADDDFIRSIFDAPIVVRFSTVGAGGAVAYAGLPGETDALFDPSATFDGDRVMFRERLTGIDSLVRLDPLLGEVTTLLEDTTIEGPSMTADGLNLAFADLGTIVRATIDVEAGAVTDLIPVPPSGRQALGFSPFWAKSLPPPPPPPPGQIAYEDTTVGGMTFQRPEGVGPLLLDGEVAFHAFPFTVETGGFYDFLSEQDYDGYLHLYADSFDPQDPLGNVLAGNDDLQTNRQSGFAILLEPAEYVVVTSAFAAGDEGTFTNTITPRPVPGPGEPPAIEQFIGSTSVAEPGVAIEYTFFVSSADPTSCSLDFGDGTVIAIDPCTPGTLVTTSHAFDAVGFYSVVLTVTNVGGEDSAQAFPTIAVDDPVAFDIVVVFANDGLSPAQRAAFEDAAERWGQVIIGDLVSAVSGDPAVPAGFSCRGEPPFTGFIDDVVISASGEPIDGPGSVLGSAGPCLLREPGSNGALGPLPLYGAMRFDVADLEGLEADGTLGPVILHEMGHVLGLGSLWEEDGLLIGTEAQGADPESPDYDPQYIGPVAVAQYGNLLTDAGEPIAATVPAENTGGPGTRESHWREVTFVDELMTGFIAIAESPLSILTIGSLLDMGYAVEFQAADPFALPPPPPAMAQFALSPQSYDLVFTIDDVRKPAQPLYRP